MNDETPALTELQIHQFGELLGSEGVLSSESLEQIPFLALWARKLERGYGTPASFADGAGSKFSTFTVSGSEYTVCSLFGGRHDERRALMRLQKRYKPHKINYGFDLHLGQAGTRSCLLCENVAQALDGHDNVIFDFGDYMVMPNRYPARYGHSLLIPKNHDPQHERVERYTRSGQLCIPCESGKVRGNILTEMDLYALVSVCDVLDLVGSRNHVLAGMSIPEHDHFHLMPKAYQHHFFLDRIAEKLRDTEVLETRVSELGITPFDTLLVYDRNRSRAISRVCNLLERLERSDRVFTLTYHAGKFLISPRHADVVGDTPGDCGGGAEVHTFDPSDLEQVVKYVPLAGEYDWGQFVAADDVLY